MAVKAGWPVRARTGSEPGHIELLAPRVGLWRDQPQLGHLVRPGTSVGTLEVLGRLYPLVAPSEVSGIVASVAATDRARHPVGYGEVLVVIDKRIGSAAIADSSESEALPGVHEGLVFAAPMSGRYYSRPGPDRAPFIEPGQMLKVGESVCLLEVMKTFNRVAYGGEGLPEVARVKRVVPADGDDLNANDPILELEVD